MAMNIDLKNLNMSDIKDQITKLADKKTLTKIGIIFGAIVLFLIIYYAILNPMVKSRKAKLDDMNLKKQEIVKFTNDINAMKAFANRPILMLFTSWNSLRNNQWIIVLQIIPSQVLHSAPQRHLFWG